MNRLTTSDRIWLLFINLMLLFVIWTIEGGYFVVKIGFSLFIVGVMIPLIMLYKK